MLVKEIFNFLNLKFPVNTACSFDNVGILAGDPDSEVKRAVITLDCTLETVEFAVENNCQLIITHHPVIFEPLKNLLKGSVLYEVISNKLSVISMHTNLDVGDGGVNDCLCKALGLNQVKTVLTNDNYLLRTGNCSPITADKLALLLKEKLTAAVKYTDGGAPIQNILICSGSGGNYLSEVQKNNCTALITADVKHSLFLEAQRLGISLFDAGHFNTEDVVIEPLKELLNKQFKDIEFLSLHACPIKSI